MGRVQAFAWRCAVVRCAQQQVSSDEALTGSVNYGEVSTSRKPMGTVRFQTSMGGLVDTSRVPNEPVKNNKHKSKRGVTPHRKRRRRPKQHLPNPRPISCRSVRQSFAKFKHLVSHVRLAPVLPYVPSAAPRHAHTALCLGRGAASPRRCSWLQ
jgi:hypothetical protein